MTFQEAEQWLKKMIIADSEIKFKSSESDMHSSGGEISLWSILEGMNPNHYLGSDIFFTVKGHSSCFIQAKIEALDLT